MKATSRSGLLVGVALVSIAVVSGFVVVPSTGFVARLDGSKGTVFRCTTTSACGLFDSTSVLHSRRTSSRHNRVSSLSMSTPNGGHNDTGDSQGSGDEDPKGIYGFDRDVISAEAAEAPFRKLRLIAYGVLALTAVALGGVSIAGLAGVEGLVELGENLPNPLLDAAVFGLAFYLWVEEVKTKRSALRVVKNRQEEDSRVPNRTERRQKKSFGKKAKQVSAKREVAVPRGVAGEGDGDASSTVTKTPATTGNLETSEDQPAEKEGMFGGMKRTLEAVNQQSYYQALALNKELEDKGVLPRLESTPGPPGGERVVADATGSASEVGVEEDAQVVIAGSDGEGQEVSSRDSGKTRRGKGGKKGKRKK